MKNVENFGAYYAEKIELRENANYEKDLQTLFEEDVELSPAQKRYADFMTYGMSKFGAESPADLSDEDKKELFNWIKDNWDKDKSEPSNQKVKDEIAKAKKDGKIKEPKSGKEAANESEELDFTGVFDEVSEANEYPSYLDLEYELKLDNKGVEAIENILYEINNNTYIINRISKFINFKDITTGSKMVISGSAVILIWSVTESVLGGVADFKDFRIDNLRSCNGKPWDKNTLMEIGNDCSDIMSKKMKISSRNLITGFYSLKRHAEDIKSEADKDASFARRAEIFGKKNK